MQQATVKSDCYCYKQTLARIEKDTDRDFFMDAEEAKAYGIVDEIYS